jgi:hypothetical protein
MRRLLSVRQIIEEEGFDPDSVYLDPEDLVELDEVEDQED